MADSKRNSVAGKVATPKTAGASAAQPIPDTLEAIGKAIGARIKVTTAAPSSQTYEGTLYTADPLTNLIVINTRLQAASATDATTQPGDYRIISIPQIQNFQITSLADGSESSVENAKPSITAVDTKRLQQRCDDRVKALKEQEKNRGKGVTREAQAIYDAFKRINVPIRWHNQEMIVHEAVIITPPYRVEDCKSPSQKVEVLNRVRKVLDGERRKLEREERERKTATPPGPRKGG